MKSFAVPVAWAAYITMQAAPTPRAAMMVLQSMSANGELHRMSS